MRKSNDQVIFCQVFGNTVCVAVKPFLILGEGLFALLGCLEDRVWPDIGSRQLATLKSGVMFLLADGQAFMLHESADVHEKKKADTRMPI